MAHTEPLNARLEQSFDLLEHWAVNTPGAVYFRDGVHELTFSQGYEHARKLAAHLRSLGVNEGDVVALEVSIALQVLFIPAVMQLRAATMTHLENASAASASRANWLFSSARTVSACAERTVLVDAAFLRAVEGAPELRESLPYPSTDALLRIAHSSGSTGLPKQIPLSVEMTHHRALAANELSVPGSAFLSMLDLGTASGFHTYLGGLMRGAAYLNPGNAAHNLSMITRFGVTAVKASPVQVSELLVEAERAGASLESLRAIYCAGSVVPVTLRERVRRLTPARLFSLYGSTEAGRCAERELVDDELSNVGRIVEGTELRIVDEDGADVPAGETGHIRYRRAHQAREYRGDAAATAASFPDGWFVTGDLGHLNEHGELVLDGRANDVVNVGGLKVNIASIEQFALGELGLSAAACTVLDGANGIGDLVMVAETGAHDPAALGSALTARFGALAPKTLLSVPRVPRNSAGKIDREAVAALARETLGRL